MTRSRTGLLTAIAVLSALTGPSVAHAATARPADGFVDSVGVNTRLSYDSTSVYRDYSRVEEKLTKLGVRYIREGIHPGQAFHYQELRRLASQGIKTDVIVGDPLQRWGIGPLSSQMTLIHNELAGAGAVASLEGPNEYDHQGDPIWRSNLISYQQQLYSLAKADPLLRNVPVIGPTIVDADNRTVLGDISGSLDYGNMHPYPGGSAPDRDEHLQSEFALAARNSGSKPVQATETGYHNAINYTGGHRPASEEAAAIYFPRLFLDYFRRGIARTYSYELIDQRPDPGHADNEASFGLLRNDFSEKPAFTALQRTIGLLKDPGAAFTPSPLDYSIQGARPSLRQMLLQKRDGSYYLALWNTDSVWDPVARRPLATTAGSVRVALPGSARVEVYKPNESEDPIDTQTGVDSVTLSVSPSVSILKIVPSDVNVPVETTPTPAQPTLPQTPTIAPTTPAPGPARVSAPAKTPASPRSQPALKGSEARMAKRLLILARRPSHTSRARRERRKVERWLKARATSIRRQAHRDGWASGNRLARYRAIREVLGKA